MGATSFVNVAPPALGACADGTTHRETTTTAATGTASTASYIVALRGRLYSLILRRPLLELVDDDLGNGHLPAIELEAERLDAADDREAAGLGRRGRGAGAAGRTATGTRRQAHALRARHAHDVGHRELEGDRVVALQLRHVDNGPVDESRNRLGEAGQIHPLHFHPHVAVLAHVH